MRKLRVDLLRFKWLKQRPWLLVPVLGLIPLSGAIWASQEPPAAAPPTVESPSAIAASTPPSASPSPAQASPKAAPSPAAKAKAGQAPKPTATAPAKAASPAQSPKSSQRAAAILAPVSIDAVIEMRVAIAKGVSIATLGTSNGGVIYDEKGKELRQLPQGAWSLQPSGSQLALDGQALPSVLWVDANPGGLLQVGDRFYRGRLLFVLHEGQVWGINFINLKDYLNSVVGSEVSPSWPAAALKAQAVAARSYALTYYLKPAGQLYHLGDDEYYQVYSGVKTEADTVRQAVNQTVGQFVSHRGGVVESLYAASDDIVMEAFGGRGMSQLGALDLAKQGYTYQQILATYYPGTGIGRVELDHE